MTDYPNVAPVRSDHATECSWNVGTITEASLHDAIARRTLLASIIVTVHRDNSQRRQRPVPSVGPSDAAVRREFLSWRTDKARSSWLRQPDVGGVISADWHWRRRSRSWYLECSSLYRRRECVRCCWCWCCFLTLDAAVCYCLSRRHAACHAQVILFLLRSFRTASRDHLRT